MTTPQSMLHDIYHKLNDLIKVLNGDYDYPDIDRKGFYDLVLGIEQETKSLSKKIDAMQDQMALIVKLLSNED